MTKEQKIFIDQMGREVKVNFPPSRIISVVPSQTELLSDLGLHQETIGITKFCIHPTNWLENKTQVGGTKKLDFDKISSLKPDLIIANKEENSKAEIEQLANAYPVWISDIHNLSDALEMIQNIGLITNKANKAQKIVQQIESSFKALEQVKSQKRVLYLIWKNPYMAAGKNTFIDKMIGACGFENVITESNSRYPALTTEQIEELHPDLIFLSSEPFPFKGKHTDEVKALFPFANTIEVDGEMFSWYGSRLIESPKYFRELITQIG